MSKFYYNGVLLPEIPGDVLTTHPYAFIRDNASSGCYDLLFAIQPFYYDTSETRLIDNGGAVDIWYRLDKSQVDSAENWGSQQSHTFKGWTIDSVRTVLWTNTNIYIDGITDAYPLYKIASPPVPENAIINTTGLFLIQGETLSEIANAIRMMTGLVNPIYPNDMANLIKSIGSTPAMIETASTFSFKKSFNEENG